MPPSPLLSVAYVQFPAALAPLLLLLPLPLPGRPCPEQPFLLTLSLGSWDRQMGASWTVRMGQKTGKGAEWKGL